MKNKGTQFLTEAAVIGAIYVVLTLLFAPLSYGEIQIRFSEALTILPFFTPAAIPGLFVGCIIANLFGGAIPVDIIFGSIATLEQYLLTDSAAATVFLRRSRRLFPMQSSCHSYFTSDTE